MFPAMQSEMLPSSDEVAKAAPALAKLLLKHAADTSAMTTVVSLKKLCQSSQTKQCP